MKRSWILVGLMCILPLALGGCLTAVELSPENAMDAGEQNVNILIEDINGLSYVAQGIEYDGETDGYKLFQVEITNDGVVSNELELFLPKEQVVSVKYYKNNKWMVATLVTGASIFLVWLYYSINTSVFD
ncbi:MAG: hypothetical protein GY835_06770 [bacterium]|nr:hypothetical protein [bacterium]